ncbi:Hypothetical predicted protein [Mytilus galloprovincialis]|uniref:FYVE-type domain-containing protein n=1 Tax=Mytilus galloprovincialis TaxID=29158 RepID=A0A8B6BG75_MYTGA|nr:Hypothetical predicted protein [Mytilus galloprovincialis]
MGAIRPVKLEGLDIYPATVEGLQETFGSPNFILAKARWMSDDEASNCVLCQNKFNQLRRKHHCRMCGRILCSKCCREKMPLPQLRCEEPERVCEICRPAAECVTKSSKCQAKSRSTILLNLNKLHNYTITQLHNIFELLVELGGVQMLISMSKEPDAALRAMIAEGLHILSTHQPLHQMLAVVGVIKALCCLSCFGQKTKEYRLYRMKVIACRNNFGTMATRRSLDAVLKVIPGPDNTSHIPCSSHLSLLMENLHYTKIMDNPGIYEEYFSVWYQR